MRGARERANSGAGRLDGDRESSRARGAGGLERNVQISFPPATPSVGGPGAADSPGRAPSAAPSERRRC